MFISGLQKLTLLDYPGRVACTVFTGGCDFRCPFCHNASLVLPERLNGTEPSGSSVSSGFPEADTGNAGPAGGTKSILWLSEEEVLSFLKKRVGILDGVAVTGGEPLLHRETTAFIGKVKDLGYKVKLDTNGSFPERLKELVTSGLVDRVAMDIKSSPSGYAETVGIPGYDISRVKESRDFLLSGAVEYEFRTTVVKGLHTEGILLEAAEWIRGAKEYYLQQFKDSGDIIDIQGLSAFSEAEMRSLADRIREIIPTVELRGV